MEDRDRVKKREGTFCLKRWYKNMKRKRRYRRRDDSDRGLRPCRRSHNTIFTTHAIWFFTTLSGWLHQVFFFWMVGKGLCITTGTKNEKQNFSKREETFFFAHEKILAQNTQKNTIFLFFFLFGENFWKNREEKQNSWWHMRIDWRRGEFKKYVRFLSWSTTKEKRKKRFKKRSKETVKKRRFFL